MWCVIWKKEDSLYQIFTNLIFDSEKNAVEFINKEKSIFFIKLNFFSKVSLLK